MLNGRIITSGETKLYNLQKPIISFANIYNKLIGRKKNFLVKDLLHVINIDYKLCSDEIIALSNKKVSQICRAGSRFEKNCICVELYDDGYNAMKWAMDNGALFCITRRLYDDIPCLVVDDPTNAYAKLCQFYYDIKRCDVVAIVGSIGKTTTKNMVESVLKKKYVTFCDPDNENQIDCVGYMCQHVPNNAEVHIQEVSEDTPGYISDITSIIKPKIAIITSIDQSHIELFGSQEKIADEIYSICDGMDKDGIVIVNYDDELARLYPIPQRKITVSISKNKADYYAENITIDSEGMTFDICKANCLIKTRIKLRGSYARHNALTAMYAYVTGQCFGMNVNQIYEGLEEYNPSGIRQNVIVTPENLIYADCYNAVAESIESAIKACEEIPVNGKLVAVLGDVEEAGNYVIETHDRIMKAVNGSRINTLYAYGENICRAVDRYKDSFRGNLNVIKCDKKRAIEISLKENIKKGDLILFKASRKSELETIIKHLWSKEYSSVMKQRKKRIIKWRLGILFN